MANTATTRRQIPNSDATKFGKRTQPTPEAKRAGLLKKKRGAELAKAALELILLKTKTGQDKRKELADYFKIPPHKITVELAIYLAQAKKAIELDDTPASNFCHDRAFGKPALKLDFNNTNPEPSYIILPGGRQVEIN